MQKGYRTSGVYRTQEGYINLKNLYEKYSNDYILVKASILISLYKEKKQF